jgi:peroxiredoxin
MCDTTSMKYCSIFFGCGGKISNMKDKFKMVGTRIPEFSLPNSRGETVNIRDFEGKQNVVVVLLRGIH